VLFAHWFARGLRDGLLIRLRDEAGIKNHAKSTLAKKAKPYCTSFRKRALYSQLATMSAAHFHCAAFCLARSIAREAPAPSPISCVMLQTMC
jgi:hypothetical protein